MALRILKSFPFHSSGKSQSPGYKTAVRMENISLECKSWNANTNTMDLRSCLPF